MTLNVARGVGGGKAGRQKAGRQEFNDGRLEGSDDEGAEGSKVEGLPTFVVSTLQPSCLEFLPSRLSVLLPCQRQKVSCAPIFT
jgi:hypothetical protein